MLKRGAGPPHDGKSEDSNTGKLIPVKHLKRSGKVKIQLGAKNLKNSRGVGGAPHDD